MDGVFIANQIRYEENVTTPFTATFISFDKGGVWRPLTPPAVDRNNRPILCPSVSIHKALCMCAHTECFEANMYVFCNIRACDCYKGLLSSVKLA